MSKSRTPLETELFYGSDLKNRRIHFGNLDDAETMTEVNVQSIELVIRIIHRMESEDPKLPIELYMNSYGGDPYSALYLIDVILSSSCQFKFFGGGAIMSAATAIMAVCDERYLYKNAKVMVHNGWEANEDRYDDFHISAEESRSLQKRLNGIYAENSFMPIEFWERALKRDLYLTADEAVKLGLADFIVEYKKRGNLRKKRIAHLEKKPGQKTMKELIRTLFQRINLDVDRISLTINEPKKEEIDPNVIIAEVPKEEVKIEPIVQKALPEVVVSPALKKE